jgi:xylulokinase
VSELLLGIDVGTASSKGVLVDLDGRVVASAEREHRLAHPRAGWAEHDAETVWWADFRFLCERLLSEGAGAAVVSVGVSGIGPCVLATDAEGAPVRAAILYGIDTRATEQIAELEQRLGADAILARGGSALSTQAVGPKLLWLQQREPDAWARTRRWMMASSFLVHRLSGEYVLDHHSASQSDPLYDLRAQAWAEDWAAEVAPGLPLPRLAWPGEAVGSVTPAAAAQTGLRAGTPVTAGTVDAWAEAFSVGVRRPGDLMLMYGSTMFFVQAMADVRSHPPLWATIGVEPGSHSLAGGMASSGAIIAWLRDLTGERDFARLDAEAAAVPPGADGLLMLPYFAGERTPIADPAARGVLAGLTLSHGRGELVRAAYEATAFGVRHNLDALAAAADRPGRVIAVGGGTKGAIWPQIVSDVCGVRQLLPAERIGAAYGDALLAAIGAGCVAADTDWTRIAGEVEPDGDAAGLYDARFGRYRELYDATRDIVHALAVSP